MAGMKIVLDTTVYGPDFPWVVLDKNNVPIEGFVSKKAALSYIKPDDKPAQDPTWTPLQTSVAIVIQRLQTLQRYLDQNAGEFPPDSKEQLDQRLALISYEITKLTMDLRI